jgi:hypothetical protein
MKPSLYSVDRNQKAFYGESIRPQISNPPLQMQERCKANEADSPTRLRTNGSIEVRGMTMKSDC